jgi:hypothetical protein
MPQKGRKKKLLFVLVPVLVILLAVGGVFGLYLPNKPENVFKRGLNRTGQAVDELTTTATDTATTAKYARTNVEGNVKFDSPEFGTYTAKIDGWGSARSTDFQAKLAMKEQGLADKNLSAHLLMGVPDGKQYPDIYVQLTGLSQLGLDSFLGDVNQYDGKWLYLSSDYLKSMSDAYGVDFSHGLTNKIKHEDVTDFTKRLIKVSRDYVFNGDTQKGILENRQFLGKQTIQGVKTNHYQVGLNKEHVKQFCTALGDAAFDSQLVKAQFDKDTARTEAKKEAVDSCKESANDIKQSDTFEMWIGGKYGLVRQIRIYDTDNKKDYVDFGQQYNGGDNISLYANLHVDDAGSKGDGHASLALNAKTDAVTFDLSGKGTGEGKFTVAVHFSVTPANGSTKIQKPTTNVVDLGQIFSQLQTLANQSQQQDNAQAEAAAQTAEWYTDPCMSWSGQTSVTDEARAEAATKVCTQ